MSLMICCLQYVNDGDIERCLVLGMSWDVGMSIGMILCCLNRVEDDWIEIEIEYSFS